MGTADKAGVHGYCVVLALLTGDGWPFRVGRFYMVANNAGKVSNLTVAPHQFIPITIYQRRVAPF